MKEYLLSTPNTELLIDRINRLPKPSFLADNVPRDVLMQVHFYHVKDKFMLAFRKNSHPPAKYASIKIFADLSQYTMQKHKTLLAITKACGTTALCIAGDTPPNCYEKDGTFFSGILSRRRIETMILCYWDIIPEQEPFSQSFLFHLENWNECQLVPKKIVATSSTT